MLVFLIDNLIFLVVAIFYWTFYVRINLYVLLMGTIGVVIDSIALTLGYIALGRGPGGPIVAVMCGSTIGVTLIDAIRNM